MHPVSWWPSKDGQHLIGHMILKKPYKDRIYYFSGAAMIGLKVTVVKVQQNGQTIVVVEKVASGSIAETVGRIKPGDEVVEWNGKNLQNKSYDEVHEIIAESRFESQVEIIVTRPIRDNGIDNDQPLRRHTHIGAPTAMLDREKKKKDIEEYISIKRRIRLCQEKKDILMDELQVKYKQLSLLEVDLRAQQILKKNLQKKKEKRIN